MRNVLDFYFSSIKKNFYYIYSNSSVNGNGTGERDKEGETKNTR